MGVKKTISIDVGELKKQDIKQAVEIWTRKYERYCGGKPSYPRYWADNTGGIERLLEGMCEEGYAIAARTEEGLVGYLAFWESPFQGESTAYCPAFAHAAQEEYKENIYLALYEQASQAWADKGILNHMWTFFYNDDRIKGILYDLGFGGYVLDAFCLPAEAQSEDGGITRAGQGDIDELYELAEESRSFYKASPIFLKRDTYGKEDIKRLVEDGAVFIARVNGRAAGYMNASVSVEDDPVSLAAAGSVLIDEIGAYIRPEYRGRGIGEKLLGCIKNDCAERGIQHIHVDFETANPFANRFWRKHFDPMLMSVRRTVNRDINED